LQIDHTSGLTGGLEPANLAEDVRAEEVKGEGRRALNADAWRDVIATINNRRGRNLHITHLLKEQVAQRLKFRCARTGLHQRKDPGGRELKFEKMGQRALQSKSGPEGFQMWEDRPLPPLNRSNSGVPWQDEGHHFHMLETGRRECAN
jgi:hypothetical protein